MKFAVAALLIVTASCGLCRSAQLHAARLHGAAGPERDGIRGGAHPCVGGGARHRITAAPDDRSRRADRRRSGGPRSRRLLGERRHPRDAGLPHRHRSAPHEQSADRSAPRAECRDHARDRRREEVGCLLGRAARPESAGSRGQPAACAGDSQSTGIAETSGRDPACSGRLSCVCLRGEAQRRTARSVVPGPRAGRVQGRAAVHRLQRHVARPDGGGRQHHRTWRRLQVRRRPDRLDDRRSGTGRVARRVEPRAGISPGRPTQRERGAAEGEQSADCRRRPIRLAGGVSPSAHVLLDARGRDEPRLRVVPQGRRRHIRDRHPSGGARGRRAVSRQLRALQRPARKRAADAGLLLRERRRRPVGAGRRPRVHAKRSLQGAARLPGHGEPLSHGSRSTDARVGKPRHEAAGSRGAARDRDQHREPDRSARWRRPARDPRRLLRGRAETLRYELPDHAERGGQPVPWRPLGSASLEAALLDARPKARAAARRGPPQVRKGVPRRRAGGHPGNDPARERVDLHAASAHEGIHRIPRCGQGHGPLPRRSLPGCRLAVGDGPRSVRAPALRLPGAAAPRRHEQLDGGRARVDDDAEADSGDHGDLREASGRRHLREQSGQLHPVGQVAGGGRHESGHRRDPSRRLLRHLGRGVDSIVHRAGKRSRAGRSSPTSNGRSRSSSSKWSGATAARPAAGSCRRPSWRHLDGTGSRSRSRRRTRNGSASPRGTRRAMARSSSQSNWIGEISDFRFQI